MKKLKIKQKSNRSGFTLVELVIVIAIVIILSVISVPIYRAYVDKSKMAEGYALLGTILSAQKSYYSEYGNFLYGGTKFVEIEEKIGIDARGNKYFTCFEFGCGFGNGVLDMKFGFMAHALLPEELQATGKVSLALCHNITKGSAILDYPVNFKASDWL